METVRVTFSKPTQYANGLPIGPTDYSQTRVFANGSQVAWTSTGTEVQFDIAPGVYDITAVAVCNPGGTGELFSAPSAPVSITVEDTRVPDAPNPPSNVIPTQL